LLPDRADTAGAAGAGFPQVLRFATGVVAVFTLVLVVLFFAFVMIASLACLRRHSPRASNASFTAPSEWFLSNGIAKIRACKSRF
jgi:hypothetical protein